jgi:hypothetical protein
MKHPQHFDWWTVGKHTLATLTPEQLGMMMAAGGLVTAVFVVESPLAGHVGRWAWNQLPSIRLRSKGGVYLGNEWIPDYARVRHMLIVGSTGTGKSVALQRLIFSDLERGNGAFIIDPKGDRELYERVRWYCKKIGREKDLHFLSATFPEESVVWNPCGVGNADQLISKFYNAAIYSEPHYAKACENGLTLAFNSLVRHRPKGFGLLDLADELGILSERDRENTMAGLYYDNANLAQSAWGEVLGCNLARARARQISMLDVCQKNKILFVDLPTETSKVQSSRVGRLLTSELMLISGLRKNYPWMKLERRFSVFIDEFDAFATEAFATFMNKGRDSRFMIHVAHQTLSDLKAIGPEFADKVLGNCNLRLIFRLDVPDDSELMARTIGTRSVIKATYQTEGGSRTGAASNRETREFLISPDLIKTLPDGSCIFSMKKGNRHRMIRIPFSEKDADAWKVDAGQLATPGAGPTTRGIFDAEAAASLQASRPLSPEALDVPVPKEKGDGKGHWGTLSEPKKEDGDEK